MSFELLLAIIIAIIIGSIGLILWNLVSTPTPNVGENRRRDESKKVTNEGTTEVKTEVRAEVTTEKPTKELPKETAKDVIKELPVDPSEESPEEPKELLVELIEEPNENSLKELTEVPTKLEKTEILVEPNELDQCLDDIIDQNNDLLINEEIIVKNVLIEDKSEPKESLFLNKSTEEPETEVIEELIDVLDKEYDDLSDEKSLSDEHVVKEEEKTEKTIDSELYEENDFLNAEDLQILTHFNKSRPKKHKSRASVKIVFTEHSSNEHSMDRKEEMEQITEDPISKKSREIVENLFENLDSEVDDYKNRTNLENTGNLVPDSEVLTEPMSGSDVKKRDINIKRESKDYAFEEISSGDYKNFDEFSDYFHAETQKKELTRKVCQMTSVSNFEITVNNKEELNDQFIDELMQSCGQKNKRIEVFEENYSENSNLESIEVRKESKTEVTSTRSQETVLKRLSERSVSNTSLSKMGLDDLNLVSRALKSPLSESIDNVTKPLVSSPTLFRKSLIESSVETETEESVTESPKRMGVSMFGLSQSSIIKELKEKEFRKSLRKSSSSSVDNKDNANE